MLVTVSGLDGSGKSTLLRCLRTALEVDERPVVICHLNHDIGVFAAGRWLRNRLKVSSLRRLEPGAIRPRVGSWGRIRYAAVWNKPLRRVLYFVDLAIFVLYRLAVEKAGRRVLLMDRYFYDTLVDVAGGGSWRMARVLAWLIPRPDLAVLLNVSPEEAFARKGEYSVPYLTERLAAYRRVFAWVPSAIVLDHVQLGTSAEELRRVIRERYRT
jgi:thymidylate kinase